MKKLLWITAGVLSLASLAWVQVNRAVAPALSSLMPAGPLIYLEAKDFHSLLNEWNNSGVKKVWLASANYQVFSNSNLEQKLEGLYREYGAVAGFMPGLPGVLEIAGSESALGLYDLREQQFVYITRIGESQLAKSQLWRLRDKFTTRQASGITFYLRRDDALKRTVAFAFTDDFLVLATRDDLMANTLALIARQNAQSLAGEPWFTAAAAQAGNAGELRMALNMTSLIADVHFRSYWIQRNISELRPFNAEIVDLTRGAREIAESRILIREPEREIPLPANAALDSMAALRVLAPATAGLARAWAAPSPDMVESLIESKLLNPATAASMNPEYAPEAASTGESAGSEQDLEIRIDEPALPADTSGVPRTAALKQFITRAAPDALLSIQSTSNAGAFVRTPCVLVISSQLDWEAAPVREALASVGVEWQRLPSGQLNTLGSLLFAIEGRRLFLANDSALLLATLNRRGIAPLPRGPAYAAEFHAARERANYLKIMRALDFGGHAQSFLENPQGIRTPSFFSENLGSLSSVFSFVESMLVTRVEAPGAQTQRVVYSYP